MNAVWLAAHLPTLGFEIHAGANPAVPTVLIEDSRVVQANAPAQEAGIEAGATLATAHSIVAGLNHYPRDMQAECERLAWLGLVGYRFSPRVSLASPADLLIEVRGSLRLFGGLAALTEELAVRLRRQGHAACIAAAETPLAAQLLARAGLEGLPGDAGRALRRVLLKCANFSVKEPSAGEREGRAPRKKMLERLENMGFYRFEALLDLPAAELARRFDAKMVDYLARLTGLEADPREFIEPPERFRSSVHLLESVDDKGALLFPMRRLAAELADWLVARRFGTELLVWEFQTLRGARASLAVRFADPTRNAATFLALSKLRLERAELPEEVMSISLRADLVMPFEPAGADLFDRRSGLSASRAELIDQLAARLGQEAIRVLTIHDDHRPERAWQSLPPSPGSVGVPPAGRRDACAPTSRRPLWLLAEPKPVAIAQFELLAGPERIETGWWDGGACRDYFVALSRAGAQCWLFCDRHREQWHLHGYFA